MPQHYYDASRGDWVCGKCLNVTDHCRCPSRRDLIRLTDRADHAEPLALDDVLEVLPEAPKGWEHV